MFWTIIVSSLALSVFALIAIVIVTRAIENRRLVSRYNFDTPEHKRISGVSYPSSEVITYLLVGAAAASSALITSGSLIHIFGR